MGSPHKENINMATRMQQRRGTAAQWSAANPILAAGEIGFETDTSKFKMGNGSSAWSALTYFANAAELAAIIDGAPDLLNTLNELAASIGDDPTFFTSVASNLSAHSSDTTSVHGIADTSALATTSATSTAIGSAISTHNGTTNVHGITDTSVLATVTNVSTAKTEAIADAGTAADSKVSLHSSDTTGVHGIADTSALATTAATDTAIGLAVSTHNSDTTEVHGIADTSALALTADVSAHTGATLNVHGIADTEDLVTTAILSTHTGATTSVHGIDDTSLLVTTEMLADAVTPSALGYSGLAGVGLDYDAENDALDIDSTVATKTYADNAVSTHQSDTTNVHGITDTSLLALKSEVAAVTKTTLGLGNVDNTADASKPVSTAQSTAIATAKAEAIADATSQVNALLTGAPAALNTLDELAAALGDDANFAASVTTSLGLKVDSLTPISQKTASYTLSSLTERDDLIEMGSASALTLTIPTDATLNFPIGTSIDILQTGAGQVTIAPVSGAVTVNATPGLKLRTTWSSCTLFKRAANTWVVYGDLTA
jgi:hypothetical protein